MASAEETPSRTINAPTQVANPVCTSCLRKECTFGLECVNLHDDDGCNPGNGRLFGSKCTAVDVRKHILTIGSTLSEPRKVKAGKKVHIHPIVAVSQSPSLPEPRPSHKLLFFDGISASHPYTAVSCGENCRCDNCNQDEIENVLADMLSAADEVKIVGIIDVEYGHLLPEELAAIEEQCDEAELYFEFAREQERLYEINCSYCGENACLCIDDPVCCSCGTPLN